jgi:hypothetical protein
MLSASCDRALAVGRYDQLFIVINGYYILRWLLGREEIAAALEWSEKEEALYTKCFAGLGFRRAQVTLLDLTWLGLA